MGGRMEDGFSVLRGILSRSSQEVAVPAPTVPITTLLTPSEAAAHLRKRWRLKVDEDEVRRWVRHGRVAGELDDHGRVAVDVAAVDALLAVQRESCYGKCLSMIDMDEHIRWAMEHTQPRKRRRRASRG